MQELSFRDRLKRLASRWNPSGALIGDVQAKAAIKLLRERPADASVASLLEAERVYKAAVHPVLEQPIPSFFRHGSFMPVTSLCAMGMVSSKAPGGLLLFHWLYQSHSAGMRYCNYADTSRPLDAQLMLKAYGLSTLAAWTVAFGSQRVVDKIPRLRLLGLILPHAAVGCAGAISTVVNAAHDLEAGVGFSDASGASLGMSRAVAQASVARAVLFHSVLIPGCALLAPVLAMRFLVVPRLLRSSPALIPLSSAALTIGCTCVMTPFAAATCPPVISVPTSALEPENQEKVRDVCAAPPERVWSDRILY